ncbi:MAG: hypothetical protein ACOYYI_12120 [Chloroflexota bacterium]
MKHKVIAYLLILFSVSACRPQATSIPPHVTSTPVEEGEVHPELQNIPVYTDVKGWEKGIPGVDLPKGYEAYSYIVRIDDPKTLIKFYKENMPPNGWELFNEGETPKIGNRKGFVLLFSKEGTVAQLEIIQWTTASWLVSVNFYDDP